MKKIFVLMVMLAIVLGSFGAGVLVVNAEEYSPMFGSNTQKIDPQYNKNSISDTTLELPNPVQDKTIIEVVNRMLGYLLIFSLPIAIGFIMFAGYGMVTSNGDAAKVKKAWDTVKQVLIGLCVIFLSKSIVWLVVNVLSGKF